MKEYRVVLQSEWIESMDESDRFKPEPFARHLEDYLNQMAADGWSLASSFSQQVIGICIVWERETDSA